MTQKTAVEVRLIQGLTQGQGVGMKLCEFCQLQQKEGGCELGHKPPEKMRCRDFQPGFDRFFGDRADFTGRKQIEQMALFFGLAGSELKKVLKMVDHEENGKR
jgi:hypothetical protein